MLKTQPLCRVLCESKWKIFSLQVKEISIFSVLQRKFKNYDYIDLHETKSDLWFTTLPSSKKRALSLNKFKKVKLKSNLMQTGDLVIDCKNKQLNHYKGMYYSKFDAVPLASKSWVSRKSNGDHFTILPTSEHQAFNFPASNTKIPNTFKDAGVDDVIIQKLSKMGINFPTVVQAKTIPQILDGKQVLVASDTGSGKTLAYLIPVIQKILRIQSKKGSNSELNAPLGVVVVHTKELSLQTGVIANKLCSELGIRCKTLVGGKANSLVKDPEFESVDLLVSSLGVLLKLLKNKIYSLENCQFLVVDEADSLLDDSFSNSLRSLFRLSKMRFSSPAVKEPFENIVQLSLVSATMPKNITKFDDFLPVVLLEKITTSYLHRIQPHISQIFYKVGSSVKPEKLLQYLKGFTKQKLPTIVFCNSTKCCNWVSYFLEDHNIEHVRINGEMFASKRLIEFEKFRSGEVDVLCATDVSSRGLDCVKVKRVINYEFPKYMADYIHRCGRTGRIGHTKNCQVINFVSKGNEALLVNEIEMAARRRTEIANINNNIKQIIKQRSSKHAAERQPVTQLILNEDEMEKTQVDKAAVF